MPAAILRIVFPAYVGVIVVLSLLPGAPAPPGGDKLAHFGAYALMAFLGMPLTSTGRGRALMLLAIVAIGGGLEAAQAMMPSRTPSELDLVADVAGALAGTLIWWGVVRTWQ